MDNQPTPQFRPPKWIIIASVIAIIIGIFALIIGFIFAPKDAWLWLLVNFLFFSGTANGMLAWAATFRVSQARWTPAVIRLQHCALYFAPVMAIILIILMAGINNYVPWIEHPVNGKTAWLNAPFMISRDLALMFILWGIFLAMVRRSLYLDAKDDITSRDHYKFTAISVAAIMSYTIVATVIAWDLIMSLSPEWISTMFGPYYWITNMYAGLAVTILLAAALRKPLGVENYIKSQQFQDMGNMMLGFSLFSMGLFFAQYLTIWYENLPEETGFLIVRYLRGSWPWVGWPALIVGYAIPFILLQSKYIKQRPRLLAPIAVMAIIGVGVERYVLVVPSIESQRLFIYPLSILSTLAFAGAFVLAVLAFLRRYPPVSRAQEALREMDRSEAET